MHDDEAFLKTHFNAIKVVDSTSISLPEHLKTYYRGSGGSSSESAAKIQLEYDLMNGSFS